MRTFSMLGFEARKVAKRELSGGLGGYIQFKRPPRTREGPSRDLRGASQHLRRVLRGAYNRVPVAPHATDARTLIILVIHFDSLDYSYLSYHKPLGFYQRLTPWHTADHCPTTFPIYQCSTVILHQYSGAFPNVQQSFYNST